MKRTPRGFGIYTQFRDSCGSEVRVQESSSAEGPHIWIFCKNEDPMWNKGTEPSPHLTVAQARRVRDALDRFIRANSRAALGEGKP
jgi:hypothetical protein